jgi:hypothetical protein
VPISALGRPPETAAAAGRELLTILFDVYGYNGSPKLAFKTEKGRS